MSDLERAGIMVVSVDRQAEIPAPEDIVDTKGWLRPRLWGGKPGLPVTSKNENLWEALGKKTGGKNGDGG